MKNKKKGFTLMELIIVLAIFTILLTILVPSWGYFMRRARERSANAKAKVVFSAAQTEVSKIAQKERSTAYFCHDITNDSVDRATEWATLYIGDYLNTKTVGGVEVPDYGEFYFYWDGSTSTGERVLADGTSRAVANEDAKFAKAVNNVCGTEGSYKIYVKNYKVRAVVYCNTPDGNYKGTYPKTMGSDSLTDAQEATIRNTDVKNIVLKPVRLPDAVDDKNE